MPRATAADQSFILLLDKSPRPIYAVDPDRQIVYCNEALKKWLGLHARQVVGRLVEYHSETDGDPQKDLASPLTGLCPSPAALAGQACRGTVSCVDRDGRLLHRMADFVPLANAKAGLLVLLAYDDLNPHELAVTISDEPTSDELHRVIRLFRRAQAGRYALESLLGVSSAICKVRSQVAAAAASGANVLIRGRAGSGRGHAARAIHYRAVADRPSKFVPLDGAVTTDEMLRRALDSLALAAGELKSRPTLLIEHVHQLQPTHQEQLADAIRRGALAARILATTSDDESASGLRSTLADALSTIEICVPSLVERLEDLPLLTQAMLEGHNRDRVKQVGAIRTEALDKLALYSWPGELDQLREVIAAAHQSADGHEIRSVDLPAIIHHAAKAAALPPRIQQKIVLDELLAKIEKEAIVRALAAAHGNKSEAAELLGMTRPRLYRRLVQLEMIETPISEPRKPKQQEPILPDFREIGPEEPVA